MHASCRFSPPPTLLYAIEWRAAAFCLFSFINRKALFDKSVDGWGGTGWVNTEWRI